ncbi:flagellar basal body L-ring protein FlgH [candidate division KSB1 bacterium]
MKYRIIKFLVTIIVMAVVFTGVISAQNVSSGQRIKKAGMLADVKANSIGDIVTIIISEASSARNANNTQTNAQSDMQATADFAGTFLKNLTGTVSSSTENQYQGTGLVTSSGSFSTQLTARIIEVLEDGNFLIRGTREVETNGEKQVTVVEGIIRPADITTSNTISSTKISDAKIYHESNGVSSKASKPGLFVRLLNWIF